MLTSFVCHSMGFAYGNEQVIQYMNSVKAPYSVNRLTQEVAVRALSDPSLIKKHVGMILAVRKTSRLPELHTRASPGRPLIRLRHPRRYPLVSSLAKSLRCGTRGPTVCSEESID